MMNEFKNELIIREEPFHAGLFVTVPKYDKRDSAFILSGGTGDDFVVGADTTTREIRKGKYTKLIEVSTAPYLKEISFPSVSKENTFPFEINIIATIQIKNPIVFYQNRNIDVDAYFRKLFTLDVKKITCKYSVLHYEGMDEELTEKLSKYNTIDEGTGFEYQVSTVDAVPGEKAREYVEKYGKQQLDAELKNNAKKIAADYCIDYRVAIQAEVAEGKISEAEAIEKIENHQKIMFDEQLRRTLTLKESGMLTDAETKKHVKRELLGIDIRQQEHDEEKYEERNAIQVSDFYAEEET